VIAAQTLTAERGWRRRDLLPLGIPSIFISDDAALLDAACAAYAEWMVPNSTGTPVIEIQLRLVETSATKRGGCIRVEGSRLSLTGPGIEGGADARTGRGWCSVSASLLSDASALTAEVIDPIMLFLLARLGRPPMHAAGILLGNTAVLLAGPSGSGKSTLALAAAAQGLPILSDDTVHIELEPTLRVWSLARPVHVFADEAPPGNHAIRVRGGKRKAAVQLSGSAQQCRHADRAILVLLVPGRRLELDPIAHEEGKTALLRLEAGFDLLPLESACIADALTAKGAWKLTLSNDPAAAIALLRTRLKSLAD
jgi:hypothetical protein